MRETLMKMLRLDEGLRLRPYTDTEGYLTIGIGRNLDSKGISRGEAYILLENDVYEVINKCEEFKFWSKFNRARKVVIANMCFNLGFTGLKKFKKMLKAIEEKDYDKAADEMLDSKWARQLPKRSKRLAKIMRSGIIRR